MRLSPIRCSTKRISHSWLTVSKNDRMSASSIQFTFLRSIPTTSASSASCWSAPGPEPVREPEEVFLVDRVQHHDGCALDDLVFQCGNRQRPLAAVRLRDVRPPGRLRPVRSPMDPSVQVREPWLEVCLVVRPRHAIHAGGGVALERVECQPQRVSVDVVEQRGEPFLLPLPCSLPYAVQRLGHAFPVLCPVRVCWSAFPSAPALRSTGSAAGSPALFAGFIRYYGRV